MTLDSADIITLLTILSLALVVIVLYHIMFVAVDLRRIMRRVATVTKNVEEIVLKPIAVADTVVENVAAMVEGFKEAHDKDAKQKAAKKSSKK